MPGDVDERKAFRGLAWLALGNIVCAATLVATNVLSWKFAFDGRAFAIRLAFTNANFAYAATIGGQIYSWAIICAFIPHRRFMGLLWSVAFAVVLGTIQWLGMVVRDPGSATATASMVWAGCLCLGVFSIAQGLRFLLGWRLVLQIEGSVPRAPQFQIADLIEWTVSISVFFGLGQLCGWFHNLRLLAMLIAWQSVITLPLALTIVSQRGPRWAQVLLVVCLALFATVVFNLVNWYFAPLPLPSWMLLSQMLTPVACYLLAVAVNFSIVRRIGFRWTTPQRRVQSPPD